VKAALEQETVDADMDRRVQSALVYLEAAVGEFVGIGQRRAQIPARHPLA
jgi:hypothetical protein